MRFNVTGVTVDVLTHERLLSQLDESIAARKKRRVIFCNVSTVVACRQDIQLRSAVNNSEVVSPDGMPLVWLAKLGGLATMERVDGPSFMRRAMAHGVDRGWRHYLYGATDRVLSDLVRTLEQEIPGIQVVGAESPPFREISAVEKTAAVERIDATKPDLVWVGLGMPKQELWMAEHQDALSTPVLLGVGAAFDFISGTKKRAPGWMQRSGLEWAYRLAQEPQRLGRRYVFGNAVFLSLVLRQLIQERVAAFSRPL